MMRGTEAQRQDDQGFELWQGHFYCLTHDLSFTILKHSGESLLSIVGRSGQKPVGQSFVFGP